ncbi:protein-L-isoaspartate(D-aspartate) O-methyltransferase [Candidatus Micrarchaeota archaeon]|nr:protein-L-isoaspartate(D-aspartate) O-methyltransferase [Candidatus Micrarchaeota archaeon]MBU1930841.1 protein-L-isoaspartate(D-aspartate) O-methyltransferase [Candidatus Micrarchaeota archaeon]
MTEYQFEQKRKQLVELLHGEGFSQSILNAFARVKREFFVPEAFKDNAYANDAMPAGHNQTISQPSTIAVMLDLLELKPGLKVLEVGGGTGYVLALLREIVGEKGKVFGIELEKALVERSKQNLEKNGSKGVEVIQGDGAKGLKEKSPFDRILVSAACPFIPKPLFEQLKENGICVAPVGDRGFQTMTILHKLNGKLFKKEFLENYFVFVPLRGSYIEKDYSIREKDYSIREE